MEFSKYLGVAADECSSSESGWTMYIVSSMHETNHHVQHGHDVYDHGHDDDTHGGYYKTHHNEDSDDSMVSDASSAPTRERGNSKKRSALRRDSKHALSQKQVEKKLYDRRQRVVKEEHKTRIDAKAKKT